MTDSMRSTARKSLAALAALAGVAALAAVAVLSVATAAASEELRTFASPEEAADALVKACAGDAREEIAALFGARELGLIETSDEAENKLMRRRFASLAAERLRLVRDQAAGQADAVTMHVGTQDWPFPVPIIPVGGRWRFDAAAGVQELIDRRIGRNELDAIAAMRAWLIAQAEYAAEDRDGDRVREYAQRLSSTTGRHDGLYWPIPDGSTEPPSPLGPLVRAAEVDGGAAPVPGAAWNGYRMRVLTRQGSHAPGGAHPYVLNGNMIAGCALIAWPAEHARTGLMTFIVSHHGTIYQRDFGADTARAASRVTSFDPGPEWQEVKP